MNGFTLPALGSRTRGWLVTSVLAAGLIAAASFASGHYQEAGVVAFFAIHLLYGAIVGAGYGHVVAEREWAPAGRL